MVLFIYIANIHCAIIIVKGRVRTERSEEVPTCKEEYPESSP